MNTTATAIIVKMHTVQGFIDSLRTRYATANKAGKYELQQTLNVWHKEMADLTEQLLAATTELTK